MEQAFEKPKAISVLTVNTIAFAACFACWMLYGVLVTFLVDNGIYHWDKAQMGWLIGIPVLTGSIMRLPIGVLTDQYGGRPVFAIIMILSAIAMYGVGFCNSYWEFLIAGLGFGLSGASFAVGIAYTSLWFPKERQGTALGIFGAGNAGAAITSFGAPLLLATVTHNATHLDSWRLVPKIYALGLIIITIVFWLFTHPKKVITQHKLSLTEQLSPLKDIRVWRFGLYYFFVFGGFVALSQWLIPYYVGVYAMPLALAGLLAATFSLPSGVIRALGGWMSDKYGARVVMYWVLISCLVCSVLLSIPRMDIESPGQSVTALKKGVVVMASPETITVKTRVGEEVYPVKQKDENNLYSIAKDHGDLLVWPTFSFWQEPVVQTGEKVEKKQLLARGITHIFFQANVWIFTSLVFIIGIMTGIGKAAVYRHIPDYFPTEIGVVGGIVGVIGGLGGFFGPIAFGYLLQSTGIWTTCWMVFTGLIVICLGWMHGVITQMMKDKVPNLMHQIDEEITM